MNGFEAYAYATLWTTLFSAVQIHIKVKEFDFSRHLLTPVLHLYTLYQSPFILSNGSTYTSIIYASYLLLCHLHYSLPDYSCNGSISISLVLDPQVIYKSIELEPSYICDGETCIYEGSVSVTHKCTMDAF